MSASRSPRKAAAAPEPSAPMEPAGASKEWTAAKANHTRIGNCFLESMKESNPQEASKWGDDWEQVAEEHVTTRDFFGHGATYLATTYIIPAGHRNAGQKLDQSSAEGVWPAWIQAAKKRFIASQRPETLMHSARALNRTALAFGPHSHLLICSIADHLCALPCRSQAFFRCLTHDNSPEAEWYGGVKKQLGRQIFRRKLFEESGAMSNVESEIFLKHVKLLCAALARCDHKEAAMRKL